MLWSITLTPMLVQAVLWKWRYRDLWLDMGNKREKEENAHRITSAKLEHCIGERDEWTKTAWQANDANQQLAKMVVTNRKTITSQAETIDALMNGDRSCVKGHRYYTGSGISCPHCGDLETPLHKCQCGEIGTIEDYGKWYCENCYIPF